MATSQIRGLAKRGAARSRYFGYNCKVKYTTWLQSPASVDSRDYDIRQDFSELLKDNLQGLPEKFS